MGRTARYVSFALGLWLFISAFAWEHSAAQFANAWLVGVLTMVAAAAALVVPAFRLVNTALALWLFISVFALPRISAATGWNNVLVAMALFVASLVPGESPPLPRTRLVRAGQGA